jgi:hypothetical protein
MKIKYSSSVKTLAGWRSVTVLAEAESLSEKRVKVLKVLDIDGEGNSGFASRTGANRQKYNLGYFAEAEVGKTKNISSIEVIKTEVAA